MKFAERLAAHITPEWNSQYIKYDEMKEFLYSYEQNAPILDEERSLQRYYAKGDEEFFRICDKELVKINTFFAEKLAEAQRKFETLRNDLMDISESFDSKLKKSKKLINKTSTFDDDQEDEDLVKNLIESSEPINNQNIRKRKSINVDNNLSLTSARAIENDNIDEKNFIGFLPGQSFAQRILDKNKLRQLKQKKYRKEHDLKLAFSEFYLSLILLQNYQTLNFTGFRKILKKHDKIFKTDRGIEWYKTYVETAPFHSTKKVDALITEVENLFSEKLEKGNKQRAMERLRVPPFEDKLSSWTTFRLGLFIGMVFILIPLLISILIIIYLKIGEFTFDWKVAVKLYRSSLFVILHIFFIGVNSYGWSRSGVNHVLIFEIDPRNHLSYQQLLELGSCLGIFWLLSLISYILSSYYQIEYFIHPLALVIFLIGLLINPLQKFHYSSRTWLMNVLWKIVSAPFYPVQFAHFWLADQLTSFDFLFSDIEFFICWFFFQTQWAPFKGYFAESPCSPRSYRDLTHAFNIIALILACLPSWFRFLQCLRRYRDTLNAFPHLANAVKYSTTFFDIGTLSLKYQFSHMYQSDWENPFFYLWLIVKFLGTCYKLFWDFKMDWGFFDKNAGENRFLREVIVYSSKSYYYMAIVENFVLRFIWLVRLYDIGIKGETYKDIVITILGFLEVIRRFIWNFFRLENEHLNNCGQFRAVRDISIRPIQITDLGLIEKMMDEEDGVVNRQYTLNLINNRTYNPNLTITKRFINKHPNLMNITKRLNAFNTSQQQHSSIEIQPLSNLEKSNLFGQNYL